MRRLGSCFLFALLLLSGCERAKTKLDREVDRLCAIDGGVHVYETVKLSKENFGPDGVVFPQYRGLALDKGRYGTLYGGSLSVETLKEGNPSLKRIRSAIYRVTDQKVLGEIISYARAGGDMPGPWEPSNHSCNVASATPSFEKRIFLVKEN